jgi:acetyl esterase
MPIDPQIAAMLAGAPEWPPVRTVPVDQLREAVRQSSTAMPGPDVTLASVEDRRIPGPAGELPVRIYTPEGDGPFPVIVYFHGGGWVVGDLDTQDMIARGLAAGAGSVLISVEYRLAPEHPFPAAPDDAFAATRWAAEHAVEIGGDADRLAVAGDSAGAVLACAVALQARDCGGPKLRAQVNFYGSCNYPSESTGSAREFENGPILTKDDVDHFWSLYLADPAQQDDMRASPFRAESHAGLPPIFVGTAECDPSRDDAEAYADKLRAAGVEVDKRRYAGMVHGFVSWIGILPGARQAVDDACAFLKHQFAAVPA